MTKETVFIQSVTVEGSFAFPIDMLRYDSCVPDREEDSSTILASIQAFGEDRTKVRKVKLKRFAVNNKIGPRIDRWKSFQWRVIEIDGKRV